MHRHEDVLHQVAHMARSGRDFFSAVSTNIADAEVRTTFAYIAEVKSRLLTDLTPWLKADADSTRLDPATEDSAEHISPAAIVAKTYSDMRKTFRGNAPAASAAALSFGEEQLLRLLGRAFEQSDAPALKQLLKSYHPQLVICREAMSRLRARQAA
jgi:hypothetical protein